MLSVVAVVLALNFWAPYHGNVAPCGGQTVEHGGTLVVHISEDASWDWADGYTWIGLGCEIWVNKRTLTYDPADQCMVIAHEVGHGAMGLDHSSDPSNIMYPTPRPPRACYLRFRRNS